MIRWLGLVLVSLVMVNAYSQTTPDWKQKISPSLYSLAEDGKQIDFLIIFKNQADVSEAGLLQTKNEKAHFVFNALRDEATRSQKSIISFLKGQGIPYQSL